MFAENDALSEFFGEVKQESSHKRRRPTEQPQRAKSSFGPQPQPPADGLVTSAKLVLKQEEELQVLKQDHSLILFMKAGTDSVLNLLYCTATLYRKKQAETPTWGEQFQPPRTVLALALFRELASRMEQVWADKEKLKEVQSMGWLDANHHWKYQQWNPALRCLQEDKDRKPPPNEEMRQTVEQLYASLKGPVVTRFHCTRKLTETMESQATFYLDLSSRGSGQQAWDLMMKLQGSCVLQLIGVAYKNYASTGPAGREDPGTRGAAMRRATTLVLGNESNHCCMNSWVQAMLWAIELDAEARLPQMGRCAQFFRHLCGLTGCGQRSLAKDMMWRPLIRGWRDINRQHDVVEFAAYMFDRHGVTLVQGEWEARTGIPMVGQPGDVGQCTQPLLLHLPNLPPGLAALQVQSLVDQWHAQEAIHAFTAAPSVLIIQLGRFSSEDGRVRKVHTSVLVDEEPLSSEHGLLGGRPLMLEVSGSEEMRRWFAGHAPRGLTDDLSSQLCPRRLQCTLRSCKKQEKVKNPIANTLYPGSQLLAKLVLSCPELVAEKRVLEIGAGYHGIPSMAAVLAEAHTVVATDVDPAALHQLRLNLADVMKGRGIDAKDFDDFEALALDGLGPKVSVLRLDWCALPTSAPSFQVVLASEIIHELWMGQAVLDAVSRFLEPGGFAIIVNAASYHRFGAEEFQLLLATEYNVHEKQTTLPEGFSSRRFQVSCEAVGDVDTEDLAYDCYVLQIGSVQTSCGKDVVLG
eukprot:s6280_g7.t1